MRVVDVGDVVFRPRPAPSRIRKAEALGGVDGFAVGHAVARAAARAFRGEINRVGAADLDEGCGRGSISRFRHVGRGRGRADAG